MATTTPPPPPVRPPLPAQRGGGRAPGPPRPVSPPPRSVGRWVAAGALVVVVGVVAYIVFFSGGGATYKFELENDSQLVLGDQVEVGGVPVGNVTAIALTHNYHAALITIHIEGSLVPLHRGTTAQVRVPSLTTVAGRYVSLSPGSQQRADAARRLDAAGPARPRAPPTSTSCSTRSTRARAKGCSSYFVGEAEAYAGASQELGTDVEYFGPFLASANHIFAELSKDQRTFTNFLVYSAKALTTLAAHREELTNLVTSGEQGLRALGAEQASLQQGVAQLPSTLAQGNRAFSQLPSTFAALRKLAKVAGPDTKTLAPLFAKLTPLVHRSGAGAAQPQPRAQQARGRATTSPTPRSPCPRSPRSSSTARPATSKRCRNPCR